jgi:hypothetical protein
VRARRDFSHVQRPIGVRGIKFRSKAEANYAAYLEWLRALGKIRTWSYEPHTFWFTPDAVAKGGVRRGVTSYKPDFWVMNFLNPFVEREEWHEVKGYMDARSKTALARMARYYPNEKVMVIDSKFMAALKRQVGGVVPGWLP